jgi:hypothetical protein
MWGRIKSILGQKSTLPNCIKYGTVLYAYCVFNTCIVLNLPNDHMAHPWKNLNRNIDHQVCLFNSFFKRWFILCNFTPYQLSGVNLGQGVF